MNHAISVLFFISIQQSSSNLTYNKSVKKHYVFFKITIITWIHLNSLDFLVALTCLLRRAWR